MRALALDKNSKYKINKLKRYAKKHPISFEDMGKIAAGELNPVGDNKQFIIFIQVGYKCVFSIEEHHNKTSMRHLSVSIDEQGKYPNPAAMQELMKEFGFKNTFDSGKVATWLEEDVQAVNVVEKI